LHWIGSAMTGDFGVSLVSGQPVSEIVGRRLFNSCLLAALAFLIYLPLAIIPALIQAVHRDRALDQVISGLRWRCYRYPTSCSAPFS
jgi:peptide/nickel transport system permease protein